MSSAFTWHGDAFLNRVVAVSGQNIDAAARYYANKVREAVSVANSPRVRLRSGRYVGANPSRPGQPPRKLSGHLRRSIASEFDAATNTARVGTNLPYGKFLEKGTRGGRVIVAGPGKAIPILVSGPVPAKAGQSSKFRAGNFIFRKRVRIGPMAPRPFLVPTLLKNLGPIGRIAAVNRTVA
jgi:phage gpG-like protein